MSASLVLRSLRAAVFAAVCVTLGAAGHSLACHRTPSLWAEGAGCAVAFGLGCMLGGRERSLAGICGVMAVMQVGLHMLFDTAPMDVGAEPSGSHLPGMAMVGMHAVHHPVMGMAAQHGESGRAVAAHAVASLVASWWLRRGEAAVWSLLRQVASLVPGFVAWWRAVVAPAPPSPGRARRSDAEVRWTRQLLLRHAVVRRGPPAVGTASALSE
ncbi:hypothetical protein GCM10010211_58590 [Streptomyces albospinus]|uniref:MFS transporter n=1 Tax=Streptomyces albospinus TaxID=285515 RepID=A0ABQ2VI67_9ACTN|nr:hypothetical protein [Streptomyces albospinus]GGU84846.1 hypothetical protein GCM10010211_58590 [Streptomyces albospinus]